MPNFPFLGRATELQRLQQVLQQVQQHGTHLCLISAPPGMGKTQLVREFARRNPQFPFVEGRGWDNRAAAPYHALIESLHHLRERTAQTPLPFKSDAFQHIPESALFPELATHFEQGAHPALIAFLDDLQWADESTLEWFDYARLRFARLPVLWIGAYRSEYDASLLVQTRTRWASDNRLSEIALAPLHYEDLAPLSECTDLIEQAYKNSGGVPLFLIADLSHDGAPNLSGQALIRQQLATLTPSDRDLLTWASAIGERFDMDILVAATGKPDTHVATRLNRLALSGAIIQADAFGFQFVHSRYREALLENLTPPVRRFYHAKLSAVNPRHKTYHLVHAGDPEQSIQALIAEGDKIRDQYAWKDALRYYTEAQLLIQDDENHAPEIRRILYERIGDIQLLHAREPDIARGYYEAALQYATEIRDKIRLYCRMTETYHSPYQHIFYPQADHYLEQAEILLPKYTDDTLAAWITCIKAEKSHLAPLDQQHQLFETLMCASNLTPELADRSRKVLLALTVHKNDETLLDRYMPLLDQVPASNYQTARRMLNTVEIYLQLGRLNKALHHARQAAHLFEILDLQQGVVQAFFATGQIFRKMGHWIQAREYYKKALENAEGELRYHILYRMCATYVCDPARECLDWAREALRHWIDILHTRKDWVIGYQHHDLGGIERIFRDLGAHEEFRRQIDTTHDHMRTIGYPAPVKWYFDAPHSRPEIKANCALQTWKFISEGPNAHFVHSETAIELHGGMRRGSGIPELLFPVHGDFAIQTTIPGEARNLTDQERAYLRMGTGQPIDLIAGSEALIVRKNQKNRLRLFAHMREPGEILFEVIQTHATWTLGRGLISDPHIHLRIERQGNRISAFAGNTAGQWFACGEIDLPDWDEVEVGLHGEAPCEVYSISEQAISTFRDTRLWVRKPAPHPAHAPIETPYPPPELTLHPDLSDILIAGPATKTLLRDLRRLAPSDAPVLITGETGSGKDVAARLIHHHSPRHSGPFIPLNCAALPEDLLERELFGHIRGAYTGAVENRGGLFEAAHNGTLFLDEIADTSPAFQAKLLRILEDNRVRRLGDNRFRSVDVRILCATNKNIDALVAAGAFRQDLYFRLSGRTLALPPLRSRPSEIPALAHHFLAVYGRRRATAPKGFTREAIQVLQRHPWPGNIRELSHAVAQAAELAGGEYIATRHLALKSPAPHPASEKETLHRAIETAGGNRAKAARLLGISRNTLYRKICQFGL